MKTTELKITVIGSVLLLLISAASSAQTQFTGSWEGVFMNDFKTVVEIHADENNGFSGSIQMYSGKNQIQNDQLSKIAFTGNALTFYIESKQTGFKGEFNTKIPELKGEFTFPDQSKHPITLSKRILTESEPNGLPLSYSTFKERKFTMNELKEDLCFLNEKLQAVHPALYAYTSKKEYNQLLSASFRKLDAELTLVEFYNVIAPVVESIKCSHTGIRLPQDFQDGVNAYENFFPLKLLFQKEKVYCLNALHSTAEIVPGSEIVAINQVPVQNIKEELLKFIPSEGKNTTTKNYMLNQNFNSLYWLLDNSSLFEVEYKDSDSGRTAFLKACSYSEVGTPQYSMEKKEPFSFFYDKNKGLGFLTVRSFMCADVNQYIQDMDAIFFTLQDKQARHLVIDLRGNSGGHPIFAAQLLSCLTNKAFTYFKRNERVKEFEPLYNEMSPNKLRFGGNLYVFVDGGCLSTAGHFISLVQHYTDALFIGEEPGSTFRCNDFSIKTTLPHTGIEVNIPTTTFETAVAKSEKMVPFNVDYQVSPSPEAYLKGEDSYITCVNRLIH